MYKSLLSVMDAQQEVVKSHTCLIAFVSSWRDDITVASLLHSLTPNCESLLNFLWSSSPLCVIVPHLSVFARSHSVTQMAESMTLFPVLCSLDTSLTFPACASQHLLEGSRRPLLGRTMAVGLDDVQLRQLPRRQSGRDGKTRRADEWGRHFSSRLTSECLRPQGTNEFHLMWHELPYYKLFQSPAPLTQCLKG